jgi:hypothetical protein
MHSFLKRHRSFIALFVLGVGQSSCIYSVEDDVKVTPAPAEDSEYGTALKKATKSRTVFKEFETRYQVTATYLSPNFRQAFAKRLERVYIKSELNLSEANEKAGFFISIHSPEDDRVDLTNPHHWTVALENSSQPKNIIKPILIKKLNDKERWRAYFDTVTEWTSEYLVVFDLPSTDTNTSQLLDKNTLTLMLANADGQVVLSW